MGKPVRSVQFIKASLNTIYKKWSGLTFEGAGKKDFKGHFLMYESKTVLRPDILKPEIEHALYDAIEKSDNESLRGVCHIRIETLGLDTTDLPIRPARSVNPIPRFPVELFIRFEINKKKRNYRLDMPKRYRKRKKSFFID